MSSIDKPSAGRSIAGWAILVLPLLLFTLLFINPLIHTLALSLQSWNGLREPRFAGLDNYARLFADDRFLRALGNTFASPGFYLRVLLLASGPLALALLLMELRSGARSSLHALLTPLILFSGAMVTAIVYYIYFSSMGGLAQALTPSPRGQPVFFLADPERAPGVLGNLLLANGLALALPFGVAVFLSGARGAAAFSPAGGVTTGGFWSRAWRLVVAFVFAAAGFSLIGLENASVIPLPMGAGENLITHAFMSVFRMMNFGYGAASIVFIAVPLLILGFVFIRFLENRRCDVSIGIAPRRREKLTARVPGNGARAATIIIAAAAALITLVALVVTVFLPWLGTLTGAVPARGPLPGEMAGRFFGSLAVSLTTAVLSALLCWAVTASAGFAFGYLRPAGSRWLLTVIGAFVFTGPALFFLPYYLTFRGLGVLNGAAALVLPGLLSPLGVLLFTWFFRGARDERILRGSGPGRVRGPFLLFSIPVLALYLLASLNMTLTPLAMLANVRSFPAPLFMFQARSAYLTEGAGLPAELVHLSYLMYLLPLALLVVSVFLVFPRLAFVIRRRGEAIPSLSPADGEKPKS